MKLYKKILFLIFILIIFILFVEVIARIYFCNSTTAFNESSLFKPHPFKSFVLRENNSGDFDKTNSFGYRNKEFYKDKEKGVFRIVCAGGSTTYSSGAADDESTYPAYLEKYLNASSIKTKKSNFKFEVINAGIPAYNSLQNLIDLQTWLIYLKPDLIIFMTGLNDVICILNNSGFQNDYSHICRPFYIERPLIWEHSALLSLIFRNRVSALNRYLKNKNFLLDKIIYKAGAAESSIKNEFYLPFENYLKIYADICKSNNIRLIFVSQVFDNSKGKWSAVCLNLNSIVQKVSNDKKIPFFDLFSVFPYNDYRDFFYDSCHLNHQKGGYKIWAEKIGGFIESLGITI